MPKPTRESRCTSCGEVEQYTKVEGAWPDRPRGWSNLSFVTDRVHQHLLCRVCTARVGQVLHG